MLTVSPTPGTSHRQRRNQIPGVDDRCVGERDVAAADCKKTAVERERRKDRSFYRKRKGCRKEEKDDMKGSNDNCDDVNWFYGAKMNLKSNDRDNESELPHGNLSQLHVSFFC